MNYHARISIDGFPSFIKSLPLDHMNHYLDRMEQIYGDAFDYGRLP